MSNFIDVSVMALPSGLAPDIPLRYDVAAQRRE
jgi:hypothetical protein